jgi:SAM-dependent methyltransferase
MSAFAQHPDLDLPSPWVCRFAPLIRVGGLVLDVACGAGRHARYLAGLGYRVEAVDRDTGALRELANVAGVSTRDADLEDGPWPYSGHQFDAIVVTNYLHRPLFPRLLEALADDGVLIYETFAAGNERYGRPGNPDFLLKPGELLEFTRGRLRVVAYEDLYVEVPRPAMIQRLCAINRSGGS